MLISFLPLNCMEITFLGHSSFKLRGKSTSLITDPYNPSVGLKFPKAEANIVTISHNHPDHNYKEAVLGNPFVASGPGEYEVAGVKIVGIASYHDSKGGKEKGVNTIYSIKMDGVTIAHLGDFGQNELSDRQLEQLGDVSILIIPIGGVYTVDGETATKIVSQIEPKIVIPMHYFDKDLNVNLEKAEKFLKEMGQEKPEVLKKITVKREGLPPEVRVILMEKS